MNMGFEYDPQKSRANLEKHGIDFEEAQKIWEGKFIEIFAKRKDETRFLVIGNIEGKCWSAIVTRRSEAIRIISVRRSRNEEKKIYENF